MERLISKLPPLKSLVAFEAVVRLGTVTAAAHELTSTQPAISQHLRLLESNLGLILFRKSGRCLEATPEAMRYYKQVQTALNSIAQASEKMRTTNEKENTVNIVANTGLANLWLLPLLPRIKKKYPHLAINITLSDLDNSVYQAIALRFGKLNSNIKHRTLFTENVCLICSPSFAKTHRLSESTRLSEIINYPLIHMDEHDSRWLNWQDWLALAGYDEPLAKDKVFWGNYHSVISAAKNHEGIALGWQGIISDLLLDNSLQKVSNTTVERNEYGYYIDMSEANNESDYLLADYLYQLASGTL